MKTLRQWIICTLISIPFGLFLAFFFGWLWFFFRLIFLGYGDSGPAWINLVSDIVFYGGLCIGIIGSQIFFFSTGKNQGTVEMENGAGGTGDGTGVSP